MGQKGETTLPHALGGCELLAVRWRGWIRSVGVRRWRSGRRVELLEEVAKVGVLDDLLWRGILAASPLDLVAFLFLQHGELGGAVEATTGALKGGQIGGAGFAGEGREAVTEVVEASVEFGIMGMVGGVRIGMAEFVKQGVEEGMKPVFRGAGTGQE